MKSCSHLKPYRAQTAFSLIEIILALGIIAFALVGILGLFPVAVNTAADSQHETQAALIAKSIFDELEARPGTSRYLTLSNRLKGDKRIKVDLASSNTATTLAAFDSDGKPLENPSDSMVAYKIDLAIAPVIVEPTPMPPATPSPSLAEVTVTVNIQASSYLFTKSLLQP